MDYLHLIYNEPLNYSDTSRYNYHIETQTETKQGDTLMINTMGTKSHATQEQAFNHMEGLINDNYHVTSCPDMENKGNTLVIYWMEA